MKKSGGSVVKDMSGKLQYAIEIKDVAVLFVEKTGDIKMWWTIIGIILVIIGIILAFGGTYLSLCNVINIDLKKAGTWKEFYKRGEQAKKDKSKALWALRCILIGSIFQMVGSILQIFGLFK